MGPESKASDRNACFGCPVMFEKRAKKICTPETHLDHGFNTPPAAVGSPKMTMMRMVAN